MYTIQHLGEKCKEFSDFRLSILGGRLYLEYESGGGNVYGQGSLFAFGGLYA